MNPQSFVHDKSSPTWQFIRGKSRDLQEFLRYLSRIGTSTFKTATVGYGGWDPFEFCGGCGRRCGLFGVSLDIFVLYSNDLPSQTLSLISTLLISSL